MIKTIFKISALTLLSLLACELVAEPKSKAEERREFESLIGIERSSVFKDLEEKRHDGVYHVDDSKKVSLNALYAMFVILSDGVRIGEYEENLAEYIASKDLVDKTFIKQIDSIVQYTDVVISEQWLLKKLNYCKTRDEFMTEFKKIFVRMEAADQRLVSEKNPTDAAEYRIGFAVKSVTEKRSDVIIDPALYLPGRILIATSLSETVALAHYSLTTELKKHWIKDSVNYLRWEAFAQYVNFVGYLYHALTLSPSFNQLRAEGALPAAKQLPNLYISHYPELAVMIAARFTFGLVKSKAEWESLISRDPLYSAFLSEQGAYSLIDRINEIGPSYKGSCVGSFE